MRFGVWGFRQGRIEIKGGGAASLSRFAANLEREKGMRIERKVKKEKKKMERKRELKGGFKWWSGIRENRGRRI